MGWIKDLFFETKKPTESMNYAEVLSGSAPIFSQFGQNIYASDVVQQAIYSIVSEIKKLNPRHVRVSGRDMEPVAGHIQTVLNDPNPLMTTSDFIEKFMWSLMLNYNSFIYPVYRKNNTGHYVLTALYPLQPSNVTFMEDATGTMYLKMRFMNGKDYIVPYSLMIHIKHKFSVNEFMGGNELGQPDNQALLKTLDLNETLLQGVKKALKASFAINGVVKYKTMLDKGSIQKNIQEFETKLLSNDSGLLGLDIQNEYIPLSRDLQVVDEATLKFIDDKILRQFGVSLPIVQGDFTKEQYEAFYQKTLEPLIIAISQAFTKALFTPNQKAFGNEIKFFSKELVFMTTDQKINMIKELSPTGALFENEKRVAFGFEPLPELVGKRYMSLNWVDVDIAHEYQLDTDKKTEENGSSEVVDE